MAVPHNLHSTALPGDSTRSCVCRCIFPSRPPNIFCSFSPDPRQDPAGIEHCIWFSCPFSLFLI